MAEAMTVLITGGAGFIGSTLSELLLEQGHRVLIVDDLSTGSMRNIQHLKGHPEFEHTIDSVLNRQLIAELVDRADLVFHLAAAVGVQLIVSSPVRTIETNVEGTGVVLEQAAKKRKRVFIASTSEVYGKSKKIPFSEEQDLILGPSTKGRWSYACSKALDEFLALAFWKEKRVPVTVLRLFNTVGPRQVGHYGMVLPRFVTQALAGEPLTVHGDGTQTRCFCHVSDVVKALAQLAHEDRSVGEILNIGSDEEVSIMRLAELVRELAGSSSEIIKIPYHQAYAAGFEDMARRVPDISKIHSLIGFRPEKSLSEIIKDVIHYHKSEGPEVLR